MKSRKLLIGCGIALLALGIVIIGVIASFFIPKTNQQAPSGTFSILVNINLPLNGAELPLSEPVSIYAEAVGDQPVHSLELWLDGAFSPTKMDSSPADKSPLSAVWLWTPTEEGAHRLIVRAIGPNGETINSNVVRVLVSPREKIVDLQVTDIPIEELLPPDDESSTEAGAFQLPEGPAATPPPPPFPPEDQPQVPADPPAGAPGLQGSINQCDATLFIQDNADAEKGFYLYRFDPISTGFTRVATLDKHAGTGSFNYLDPGLSLGDHTYYIASFDGTGESVSNMISLKVTDAQCAGNGPQALGLKDAILTTTKAVDKIYCYLSVDQGPWKRIPYGSNKFIQATNGGFDLGDYLDNLISPPPPGGVTLELECWGWSGNTLVYLGYLKQTIDKGPVKLIGIDFDLLGKLEISEFKGLYSLLDVKIAPPFNVNITNDLNQCKSILTGFYTQPTAASFCKQFLDSGQSILYWKWEPGCPFIKPGETCPYSVADIDGYHVYRVYPASKPQQISTSANGPALIFTNITPTGSGVIIPPQYFVSAYKGILESAYSNPPIKGIPPKYTVTLTNPRLWYGMVNAGKCDCFIGCSPSEQDFGPTYTEQPINSGPLDVGYDYFHQDCGYHSAFFDGHVVFDDLSQIKGQVTSAILRWEYAGSKCSYGGCTLESKGCLIPLVDQNAAIIANYPLGHEYDVTTQVRAWVQGLPNKGFALLSGDRVMGWYQGEACTISFKNFTLEVTYTK